MNIPAPYTPDTPMQEWIEAFVATPKLLEFDRKYREAGEQGVPFKEHVLGQLEEKGHFTIAFMVLADIGELGRARRFFLRHKKLFMALSFPAALVLGKRVHSVLPDIAQQILKPHHFDMDRPYAEFGVDVEWFMRKLAGHLRELRDVS